MADRVDVPALLREAASDLRALEDEHRDDAKRWPSALPDAEAVRARAAYLDRLADAVEDWQRNPTVGRVTDLMVALKASLAGPRVLALLRGEVAP